MIATRDSVAVRSLARDAEVAAYFALAAATFPGYHQTHCTPTPGGDLGAGWRAFVEGAPAFEPAFLRGAFLGDRLVGGYQHDERWLMIDGVPIRSGYVGGVVTEPGFRGRGVATALMRDGLAFARERRQALIVLRGIPDFYGRFGYTDVMEVTEHCVERESVLAQPAPTVSVRPATLDDAPFVLDLYERRYGRRTGGYARTLAQQRHLLLHRTTLPLLALDGRGQPSGYLLLPAGPDRARAVEVVAADWAATLALLREHAVRAPDAAELRWPLPPDSRTYYCLADHLPVRSETRSRPNAGWLARPGDVNALVGSLLQRWRERWRRARVGRSSPLTIEIQGEAGDDCGRIYLRAAGNDLRRVNDPSEDGTVVRLSQPLLTQMLFGFRRASSVLGNDEAAMLEALFPAGTPWYAASNRC